MRMTRFIRLVQTIIRETFPNYVFLAKYRYRVVRMIGNRVELQAVSKAAGLPDTLPISVHPGVAGASAQLTLGSIVLVEFIEGDPKYPIVTHFDSRDSEGFLPVKLFLDSKEQVYLGTSSPDDEDARPIARVGDPVECLMPALCPITGTVLIGGTPTPITEGFITIADTVLGTITAGAQRSSAK